jgi:hypothetical protein
LVFWSRGFNRILSLKVPVWRKVDKTVVASVRFADGCEGFHDLVDAGFKLGDLERLLKKRERGRVLTHRLILIDASPLRIHRDLCAVCTAMEAGRNKARRPAH